MIHRVLQGFTHQAFAPLTAYRFNADAARLGKADLFNAHRGLQKFNHLFGFGGIRRPLNPCVNVFGVFAENHHVDFFRVLHGRRGTCKVAHGSEAHVKIERLA